MRGTAEIETHEETEGSSDEGGSAEPVEGGEAREEGGVRGVDFKEG